MAKTCQVCGLPIDKEHPGKKHFIVPEIYYRQGLGKWEPRRYALAYSLIKSEVNTVHAHNVCWDEKNDESVYNYSGIKMTKKQSANIMYVVRQLAPAIDEYEQLKADILAKQNCTCASCGTAGLKTTDTVTFRYDNRKPFTAENCFEVCLTCGEAIKASRKNTTKYLTKPTDAFQLSKAEAVV